MKKKIPLGTAKNLAEKIKETLSPACERIEIAGSIRREREVIGDIEIVCIPKRQKDLFGRPHGRSQLDNVLEGLCNRGKLKKLNFQGEKFKKFEIVSAGGMALDLFITSEECWPVIFAIRTGSADFSKRLVTQERFGGLLKDEYFVHKGRVWKDLSTPIELQEEEDFLELAGGWIEPKLRI